MFAAVDVLWIGSSFILLRGKKGRVKSSFSHSTLNLRTIIKTGYEKTDSCRLAVCTFDCVCVCVWAHVCNSRNNNNNRSSGKQAGSSACAQSLLTRQRNREEESVFLPPIFILFFFSRNGTSDVVPPPIEITHQKQTKGLKKHKRKKKRLSSS